MKIAAEKNILGWISEHADKLVHCDLRKISKHIEYLEDLIADLEKDIARKNMEREQQIERRVMKLRNEREQQQQQQQQQKKTPRKEM
jgi:Skp family chaperone for outer membrane proteins